MTTAPEQNIITFLKQQQAQLDALLLLLQQELAALSGRDIEQLDLLTHQKTTLLAQIQATDQGLSQQTNLADYVDTAWFKESVSSLESLLEQCKAQTQVNQQVLDHSQLTLARLKNEILSAKGKSGLTYTNKGKPAVDNKGSGIKA